MSRGDGVEADGRSDSRENVATDQHLVRRLARDHWVRLHGTPRITVLAGGRRARAVWLQWSALTGIEGSLIDADDDFGASVNEAVDRMRRDPTCAVALVARDHVIEAWKVDAADRVRTLVNEGLVHVPEREHERPDRDRPTTTDVSALLDARSIAEAMLFEALEATAATKGRFELNGYLSVRFGPDAAEVDLLDRQDAIAIEIDGYHHFTDADAYRRDRRKDVLLQSQGLFVLRFLAEDVVRDPTAAVNDVCQALAARKGRP